MTFLTSYSENAGLALSASAAGVSPKLVRQLRATHPRFAEAMEDAENYYFDVLAKDLPTSKTPIGRIARLKSGRPAQYEQGLIVQQYNQLNQYVMPMPPGTAELIAGYRERMGAVTDTDTDDLVERYRKRVAAEVIDMETPALPEPPTP